jgi:hypothetical protein
MMRSAAILALLSVASVALAAPKSTFPRFGALPAGKVAPPPRGPAPSVAATERAAYFAVAGHSHGFGESGIAYLFPTDAEARAYATASRPDAPLPSPACYVVRRPHERTLDDWPSNFEPRPHVAVDGSPHPALAVHYERLVAGSSPRLELADAWVDPSTRGARSISRSTLPLALVASGPRGVRVYAAREGRSVHFVVTRAKSDLPRAGKSIGDKVLSALLPGETGHDPRVFLEASIGGMHISGAGGEMGRSDCGHARVRLDSAGGGSTTTLQTEVVLPEREGDGDGALAAREIRLRSLQIHLSVSQLSADREPVLSVSFGWQGRPRSMSF